METLVLCFCFAACPQSDLSLEHFNALWRESLKAFYCISAALWLIFFFFSFFLPLIFSIPSFVSFLFFVFRWQNVSLSGRGRPGLSDVSAFPFLPLVCGCAYLSPPMLSTHFLPDTHSVTLPPTSCPLTALLLQSEPPVSALAAPVFTHFPPFSSPCFSFCHFSSFHLPDSCLPWSFTLSLLQLDLGATEQ